MGNITITIALTEVLEGHGPALPKASRARPIDQDTKYPGAQRGTPFKIPHPLKDGQPGFLDDFLGYGVARDESARNSHQ